MKPILWALALLALLSTPSLATAYYDPGVQRWINRDPVADEASVVTLVIGTERDQNSNPHVQETIEIQRFRSPVESFAKINVNLVGFVSNDPLSLCDLMGLFAPCRYLCTRISTLVPIFICVHDATDNTDCPDCGSTIDIVFGRIGRYRIFFVTNFPCPLCAEHDKPEPGA